jgi:hypothetical protein
MHCCEGEIDRHKRLLSIMFEGCQFNMAFFSRPVKVYVQFLKSFGEAVTASGRGDISSLTLSS